MIACVCVDLLTVTQFSVKSQNDGFEPNFKNLIKLRHETFESLGYN